MVVATVAQNDVSAAPGPATLAAHGRDGLKQRNRLRDVVAVAARQRGGEGNPVASVIR